MSIYAGVICPVKGAGESSGFINVENSDKLDAYYVPLTEVNLRHV